MKYLNLAKIAGGFILADLLFLPYNQNLIIPYSLPIVFIALFFFNISVKKDFYFQSFCVISVCCILSLMASLFLPGSIPYISDNVKRVLQLLSSFGYFFYFRWLASKANLSYNYILAIFMGWYLAISVYFFVDAESAFGFLKLLYGRTVAEESDTFLSLRFPYFFSDPNTAIYFYLIGISPLLKNKNYRTIVILMTLFPLLLSQSRGAIIAFLLSIVISYSSKKLVFEGGAFKNFPPAFIFLLLTCVGVITFSSYFESNEIIKQFYDRIFEIKEGYGFGTAGGRSDIWMGVISNYWPLPLGRGDRFDDFGPHSDFLAIIYSYGFISLPFFLWFFFNGIKRFPQLIIIGIVVFTINSLIHDQKLLCIYLSFLGIYVANRPIKYNNC